MRLLNTEPKNSAINVRCNEAERAMIDAIRNSMRPRVSASKLILFLCEEKAREMGLLTDIGDGKWYIDR